MSGKVISRPDPVHSCSPGWTTGEVVTPDGGRLAYLPDSRLYPPGTAWQCDGCGAVWIVLPRQPGSPGIVDFRRERWLERRRRNKRTEEK
ncbi:MAG TPA: hypothetical protein VFQ44_02055 [Streptosporangiaceae bacterium]|nr:hypothetical protein [Streptosporangiaceae bacterium]